MTDPIPLEGYQAIKNGYTGRTDTKQVLAHEWWRDISPNSNSGDFVEGLLCSGGFSVLYGESNTGKTHLGVDIAFHVAAGRRWFNREIDQGAVVYIAAEGGNGIRKRVFAIKISTEIIEIPFAVAPVSIDLSRPSGDADAVIDLCTEIKSKTGFPVMLIVVDTLSRALAGCDENSSEGMGSFVRTIDRLRGETGAHVMAIHHSGKDQARGARGHSLLRAAVDTEIEVIRDKATGIATASVVKQRDLECAGQFSFKLRLVHLGSDHRGKAITSCVVEGIQDPLRKARSPSSQQEAALNVLSEMLRTGGRDEAEPQSGARDMDTVSRRVTVESFRQELQARRVTSESSDTERSQWKRIKENLLEFKYIEIVDDHVSIVRDARVKP